MMSTNQLAHRWNTQQNEPVRRVTIQQRVLPPPTSSVATTRHSGSVRRYPNVEYHDPSARGRRGRPKPSRGVVANIVNNLESGRSRTGERVSPTLSRAWEPENDSFSRTGERVPETETNEERKVSGNEENTTPKDAQETGVSLPVVAPKPKRKRPNGKSDTSMETSKTGEFETSIESSETDIKKRDNETVLGTGEKSPDSWVKERELWEKAVKELERVISDKDLVIENLSKVNRKLSEGIEDYEASLKACQEQLWTAEDKQEVKGDTEEHLGTAEDKTPGNIEKAFLEIPSLLYKFRDGIESKLQENARSVGTLEKRLLKCVENCNTLKKLDKRPPQDCTDCTAVDITQEELAPGNSNLERTTCVENLKTMEAELQKEKMINEDLMERFIELEELNNDYLHSIKALERMAKDVEDLRAQNELLLGKILELTGSTSDLDGSTEENEDNLGSYKKQVSSLQSTLESRESEIEELREKIVEDDELIEELRANCQREEKWNREMQRNYEWELSTSAGKDDSIEEFQECLWAREKLVRELQEQLDFEDKRCEELLEKLIASQKETEDFQEMYKDLRKKLEDKEKQIKEFCDQNDRDGVTIGNLTLENKQLRLEVESLVKVRRNLEEDLERVSGCLEAVEADKENFLTRQESEVKKLSDQLEDEEFTIKGKDEVIEKLQENVVLLSADVQEMEFQMDERKVSLEEDLMKAREEISERDGNLKEILEKYKELQEVCECLRETISEKEGEVLDREAVMAHQRGVIEGHEKEIEGFRRICGDNSTPLNDKPELVYTESEMDEVTEFLEQERTISEILREQVSFLENELEESRTKFERTRETLEIQKETLATARNEIKEHESKLESTNEELQLTKRELSSTRNELVSREIELDDHKTSTTLLQVDVTELNTKNQLLEAIQENNEKELMVAKKQLEKLQMEIDALKRNINEQDFEISRGRNKELRDGKDLLTEVERVEKKVEYELQQKEEKKIVSASENELEKQRDEAWGKDGEDDMQRERDALETEIQTLKRENERLLDENNKLEISLKELHASHETLTSGNEELEGKIETFTEKWLASEERVRQEQVTNASLRYSLEEYVSQSRDQIRHLRNHEREVATLTEHIHEMDTLVQGFKTSLQDVVENEMKKDRPARHENNLHEATSTTSQGEPAGTPLTRNSPKESSSAQNSGNSVDGTDREGSNDSAADQEKDSTEDDTRNMAATSPSPLEFMKSFYRTILSVKIPRNVVLILVFLILIFCLGCTDISIISRKYLFVFANSFITLVFFALWINEIHKNRYNKIFGENSQFQERMRGDGYQSVSHPCENCGIMTANEKLVRYAKIKTSFQELHEKFLEAVEKSSKDTLPIQELYEGYEKLKEDVEEMRKERLEKDMTEISFSERNVDSRNDSLPPKWNKAATVVGKALVIALLCEVFYIRGISFFPYAANLVSYLSCLITFFYFYETTRVDDTTRVVTCATQREMELQQEMEELNHIIEKEHELVTAQREAIKALERRLRKEFEKRIKQRNVLLKKLKYKGKLEDLQELLNNEENDEHKGSKKSNAGGTTGVSDHDMIVDKKYSQRIEVDINRQNVDMYKVTPENKILGGINMDKLDASTEKYMKVNEVHVGANEVTTTENNITQKLQGIVTRAEKQSLHLEFVFSPMFYLLGLPLTAILLSCRYITVPVLMMATQGAVFLQETNFIETQALPKILRKDINPIVMDSVVVLYTCVLAVCLQCTQSIVVMITCAVVQLIVHWWTNYKLAKREDTLNEIRISCLAKNVQ